MSLAATGSAVKVPKPAGDDKFARVEAVNGALEKSFRPLFEAYADIVRKAGRTCDYKVLTGSAESYPMRAAVAEFWLDLTNVPGVAQYFMRFESDGGDWTLVSRPGLDPKRMRHDSAQISIPNTKNIGANVEGVLQRFIRLTF